MQIIMGIIVAPAPWLAGRELRHKAKFTHAIWIAVLDIILAEIVGALVGSGLLSTVIMSFV